MEPTNPNRTLTVVVKDPATLVSPDSTTLEVTASATGVKGTKVNLRGTFTTNGATPSFAPTDPASNYTVGDEQKFQVVPPRFLAEGGVPARPYTMKILVEAENILDAADKVEAFLDIVVEASVDHINGLTPIALIYRNKKILPITSGPTVTMDGARVISTITSVLDLEINDPVPFQIQMRINGPPGSAGKALLHMVTAQEPSILPALPAYGDDPLGELSVGDELLVFGPTTGGEFREGMSQRKLYAAVRAIDKEDTNNVRVSMLELNIKAGDTLTDFIVLVRVGRTLTVLEDLPVVDTAYQAEVGDLDTFEVLLQPVGTPGTLAIVRGVFTTAEEGDPDMALISDAVGFTGGQITFSSQDGFLGHYAVDNKAAFIERTTGAEFREQNGELIKCLVDGTSGLNIANTISKAFSLRVKVPELLTGLEFFYTNSRNFDSVLPLQAGTDINGTITGTGTFDDPLVLELDAPEQLQVFAVPQHPNDEAISWVQTGYAFGDNPVDVLYPGDPSSWQRAFTRLQRALVLPHPVFPGTQQLPPPRGDELIVMSGGTPVGDPGTDPGYSRRIRLYARGQSTANSTNIVERTLFIKIVDPSVLGP